MSVPRPGAEREKEAQAPVTGSHRPSSKGGVERWPRARRARSWEAAAPRKGHLDIQAHRPDVSQHLISVSESVSC